MLRLMLRLLLRLLLRLMLRLLLLSVLCRCVCMQRVQRVQSMPPLLAFAGPCYMWCHYLLSLRYLLFVNLHSAATVCCYCLLLLVVVLPSSAWPTLQ